MNHRRHKNLIGVRGSHTRVFLQVLCWSLIDYFATRLCQSCRMCAARREVLEVATTAKTWRGLNSSRKWGPLFLFNIWLHHRRHDAGQVWGSHTRAQICDLRQFVIQRSEKISCFWFYFLKTQIFWKSLWQILFMTLGIGAGMIIGRRVYGSRERRVNLFPNDWWLCRHLNPVS